MILLLLIPANEEKKQERQVTATDILYFVTLVKLLKNAILCIFVH